MNKKIITILLINLAKISHVLSEGYICPYPELGANGDNILLYDYYDTNDGYWTRNGQTGWQSLQSYCYAKGDLSIHSDAGEWKCNDSYGMCNWTGSTCVVTSGRKPDCKEMCQAVLNNEGPDCLGNCPGGRQSNFLYDRYANCDASSASTSIVPTTAPTRTVISSTTAPTRTVISSTTAPTRTRGVIRPTTRVVVVTRRPKSTIVRQTNKVDDC